VERLLSLDESQVEFQTSPQDLYLEAEARGHPDVQRRLAVASHEVVGSSFGAPAAINVDTFAAMNPRAPPPRSGLSPGLGGDREVLLGAVQEPPADLAVLFKGGLAPAPEAEEDPIQLQSETEVKLSLETDMEGETKASPRRPPRSRL
ncbi:unnamed protein product, partial [Polarella glacialis]